MTVRTRIAPSPTGEFHIGGMRTLLYNYALAKKNGGQFILRVEDTDRKRLVPGCLERIIQVVKDYGLSWDEGPEVGGKYVPYMQSKRLDIYIKYALELVEKGHAYYCFCSAERLEQVRNEQRAKGVAATKYDKRCLKMSAPDVQAKLAAGEKHVVRMKIPENEEIAYTDLFLGKIAINSNELDDQVLLKSDGFPTYHLAVVVDDHLMEISHILRGVEWLPSTPKHVLLYRYFGWEMPLTGHLSVLKEVNATKKMSKRDGSTHAVEFLQEGYLPEALLNFLMFLGWNPGTEKEIYSLDEFVKDFSLEKIHHSDFVSFDREKLLWMNGLYTRNLSVEDLWQRLLIWSEKFNQSLGVDSKAFAADYTLRVLKLVQERLKLLSEFKALTHYFFADPVVDRVLLTKFAGKKTDEIMTGFITILTTTSDTDWNRPTLDRLCHDFVASKGYKLKEAFMTLRTALSGEVATPPLFDVLELLGKEITLARLKKQL